MFFHSDLTLKCMEILAVSQQFFLCVLTLEIIGWELYFLLSFFLYVVEEVEIHV